MKKAYNIRVEYHSGPLSALDEKIKAGTSADNFRGSSYGFGLRELSFGLKTRKSFMAMLEDLVKLVKAGYDLDITTDIQGNQD